MILAILAFPGQIDDQRRNTILENAPLEQACRMIPEVPDACELVALAAAMLSPTYERDKAEGGEERLRGLGYFAEYYPAGGGLFKDTTDVFLAAKPGSNRLFLTVTGTESGRDWYENAKAAAYTTKWRDGYFYTPPGYAGFRSGALNVIGKLLWHNEFDNRPLDCKTTERRSPLAKFLCESGVQARPGDKVEVVLVGHSRGSAVNTLIAPALSGWEIVRPARNGPADVRQQAYWPLRLGAVIGFAPPYAIYTRTDAAAGLKVPRGAPDQWLIYARAGIAPRMLSFVNERDIVPQMSIGLGPQIGHRFRVDATPGKVRYLGYGSPNSVNLIQAHGSGGYCQDVMKALGHEESMAKLCDERTYSNDRD